MSKLLNIFFWPSMQVSTIFLKRAWVSLSLDSNFSKRLNTSFSSFGFFSTFFEIDT